MTSGTDVVTTVEPEVTGRRGRPRLSEGARAERRLGWLLCAPAVIVMLAVAAFPILYAVWLSLQRYDLRFPQLAKFVGLSNYAAVLSSSYWWHALIVTLIITVVSLAVEFVRKTTPFMALLLMAGLSLVPEDLLKAARVDGATAWQRFYRVTLPLMKPAILVALLFRALDAFRIFDNIYVLTNGGNGTYSVSILGYDNLFRALNLGIGSAISILIFICVAIIAFIFIRIFGAAAPGS